MSASRDPFLLSLHFTAPHWPWEGPQDKAISAALTEAMHHDGGTIATYRAMIESLVRRDLEQQVELPARSLLAGKSG